MTAGKSLYIPPIGKIARVPDSDMVFVYSYLNRCEFTICLVNDGVENGLAQAIHRERLLINSVASAINGSSFLYETFYGGEAFWLTFMLTGVLMFSWIIPVFPVLIYWQVLYIVNRIRIKRAKVK